MESGNPRVSSLLNQLDGRGSSEEYLAVAELKQLLGSEFPAVLLEKFRSSPKRGHRVSCVFHAMAYATDSDAAVALGLEAIRDRSKIVRYRGAQLLAFSQREDVVPDLMRAIEEANCARGSDDDLLAALDAIQSKNHHYFADRSHSGMVFMDIFPRTVS